MSLRFVLASFVVIIGCGGDPEPVKTSDDASASATASTDLDSVPGAAPSALPAGSGSSAATSTTSAATSSAAPAAEAPPLVFAGLTFKVIARMGEPAMSISIESDGTILKDKKPHAKIIKNQIQDEKGTALYTLKADGSVDIKGKAAKFDDKNGLVQDGSVVRLSDTGGLVYESPPGKSAKSPLVLSVAGVDDKNRRTAVLVTALMLASRSPLP